MLRAITLMAFVVFVLVSATPAQTTDVRIERLAGLAHVWNTVKYYHPYLADRKIDWDKALVDVIPRVNAAKTDAEYANAVNAMLSVLQDPKTKVRAKDVPVTATTPGSSASGEPLTQTSGIIRIDLAGAASVFFDRSGKGQKLVEDLQAMLATAKGVVIDARSAKRLGPEDDESADSEQFLERILPFFLREPVGLDGARYRTHDGYASQNGTNSGGYHSSVVLETPHFLNARGQNAIPITFVLNQNSFDDIKIWDALQRRHLASIVFEGAAPPTFGVATAPVDLPGDLIADIRTIEIATEDGPVSFAPDRTVGPGEGDPPMRLALAAAAAPVWAERPSLGHSVAPQPDKDEPYAAMQFPSREYRLLALFRFWGVIDTFYPYKELIADTWATVLQRYIPKFEGDTDALAYQTSVYELVTELHDSHGFIAGATVFDEKFGNFIPPILLRYVEGKPVITTVLDPKLEAKVGDLVEFVDGQPIATIRARMQTLFVASTPQAFDGAVATNLLRGQKDSVAHLSIRRSGKAMTLNVPRSLFRYDPFVFDGAERKTPDVEVLPSGYGYVDLARLTNAEVPNMFKKIASTKGTIFDMRGYPNGTAWSIAPRLTTKREPPAALFSRPIVSPITLTDHDFALSRFTFKQRLPVPKGDVYEGKVVMLIDDRAISQSEHSCLFFETATAVTFIGTPTTGANGDVTTTVLPGGIYIYFTGQSVQHIDGRQLQRLGIQPTIRVEPTIAGVTAGRDEVLEAAVKYLKRTVK